MSNDVTLQGNLQFNRTEVPRAYREDVRQTSEPDANVSQTDAELAARREKLVAAIAKSENIQQGNLVIERDQETRRFVHKIVDPDSGETLRQWPEEDWLSMVKGLEETYGRFVDKRV